MIEKSGQNLANESDSVIPEDDLNPRETAVIPTKQIKRHLLSTKPLREDVNTRGDREIILVIRGIIERFVVPKDRKITLGRSNDKMRYIPDIDLTPYGALDRGVSREHAEIWIEDSQLYIQDVGSTNGTFLRGKPLEANKPTLVTTGDELLFGRLSVQILFR